MPRARARSETREAPEHERESRDAASVSRATYLSNASVPLMIISAPNRMRGWKHGRTVVNGELRFLSVSQIEMADASSETGCVRRWWFDRLKGIKDTEESESLKRGNKVHGEIEHYLKTGDRSQLSSIVMRVLHQLPTPGPDLGVELDIVPDLPDGKSGLSQAKLRVAGIPVVGKIDLLHWRPENPGVLDITQAVDPLGVLKLCDHKSPGKMARALLDNELADETQMAGYAIWGFETYPGLQQIRLFHNYVPATGNPRLATLLVDRERVEPAWNHANAVARTLKDAARETDPDKVDANTRACNAYYRQCPAYSVCSAAGGAVMDEYGLSDYIGDAAADRIIPPSALIRKREDVQDSYTDKPTMTTPALPNVFAFVQNAGVPAPAPGVPPTFTMPDARTVNPGAPVAYHNVPTAAAGPTQDQINAEMARLAAQEAAARAAAAPPPVVQAPASVAAPVMHPVLAMIEEIKSYGMGLPELTGFAAGAVGNLMGVMPTPRGVDHFLPGIGELAGHKITDINLLPQLLNDVKYTVAHRQAQATAAPAPAPVAAAPAPAVVAAPVVVAPTPAPAAYVHAPVAPEVAPTITTQMASNAMSTQTVTSLPVSILPPDAPPSNPALASTGPAPAPVEKVKKERKKKSAPEALVASPPSPQLESPPALTATDTTAGLHVQIGKPEVTININTVEEAKAAKELFDQHRAHTPAVTAHVPVAVNFYVDCTLEGVQAQSFRPMVDYLVTELNKLAGTSDFRDVPRESKFAFGGWRAIIAASIRDAYKKGSIPAGNYALTSLGEIDAEVVVAMRDLAGKTGGVFVKGAR